MELWQLKKLCEILLGDDPKYYEDQLRAMQECEEQMHEHEATDDE